MTQEQKLDRYATIAQICAKIKKEQTEKRALYYAALREKWTIKGVIS